MSTYLVINILTIGFPLILSFDKKVAFYKLWRYLFPAIFITATTFIVWDVVFTNRGIWYFNKSHLSGLYIFNLPVEEILFFITIPYASVFTYEVLNIYIKRDILQKYQSIISLIIILLLSIIGIINLEKLYTSITFFATAIFLFIADFILHKKFLSRFYLAYVIILFPFLLVNGILTGSFLNEPVVIYNNAEILGLRLFTIPVEDAFYGILLFLCNVFLFEEFRKNRKLSK
ncbi:MAG: lycopene cyclase domain-containing protein [Bacteroidales bacterium]|nr:lycopene cyclase domain-containing protein [Bacteroidales bacterium]